MANAPVQLCQAAITASVVTEYTVPGSTTVILKSFDVCNTTGAAIMLNLFLVPPSGTAGAANALLYGYSIAANDSKGWEGEQVLPAGASIAASASTTGLTITASGVSIT